MDKLINHRSKLGLLSLTPLIVIVLLSALVFQYVVIYKDIIELSCSYGLNGEYIKTLRSLLNSHLIWSLSVIGASALVLMIIYIFEQRRRKNQNRKMTESLSQLNILSMIKESRHTPSRERI